jgi:ankyrin repeat protein
MKTRTTVFAIVILISAVFSGLTHAAPAAGGRTPLYRACESGNTALVRKLLDGGANINQQNGKVEDPFWVEGATPIFAAINRRDTALVRLLISRGADLSHNAPNAGPALHYAVRHSSPDIVLLLINARAPLETVVTNEHYRFSDGATGTALHQAMDQALYHRKESGDKYEESLEIIKLLITAGANLNAARPEDGRTVMMMAAADNNTQLIRLLIDAKADPSLRDTEGKTALRIAYDRGAKDAEELLATEMKLSRKSGNTSAGAALKDYHSKQRDDRMEPVFRFAKAMWFPILMTAVSIYSYEFLYRDNREHNPLGFIYAYGMGLAGGAVAGGLLGLALWPADSGFLGGLAKLQGGLLGVLVGGTVGLYVAKRYDWPDAFRHNRGLYYATPAAGMTITLIAFSHTF